MPKRGLPTSVKMRHDSHYIDDLAQVNRTVGKVIPIEKVYPNPEQPRIEFGDLTELTSSIKEHGVLEPLIVKPTRENGKYMIIAGERRWRASTNAGLKEVPCVELDIDEKTIAEIALVENLQRKDLTIWETADGLADLKERYAYTHEDIAKKIGKSRTTITESLAIAGLPNDIRERCQKAKIASKSTLVEISRQFDGQAMHSFLDEFETKGKVKKQPDKNSNNKKTSQTTKKRNTKTNLAGEINTSKGFIYESADNSFELNINFQSTDIDDREILKALKEAFDSIKSRQ